MSSLNKQTAPPTPFRLLKNQERYYLALDHCYKDLGPVRKQVSMIGFRVGAVDLLAEMDEVLEILPCPDLTRIPNVHPWLRGAANIRGNLFPVMDLRGFLTDEVTPLTRSHRVLMTQRAGRYLGLLVDELYGIRRFYDDTRITNNNDIDKRYADNVTGKFIEEKNKQVWALFSIQNFIENPLINRTTL